MKDRHNAIAHSILLFSIVILVLIITNTKQAEAACSPSAIDSLQTVAHGQNLYLLWEGDTYYIDNSGGHDGNHSIYFKKSTDGGMTYSSAMVLQQSDTRCSVFPHLAVGKANNTNQDSIYVMWQGNGSYNIVLRASNDSGTTFGHEVPVGSGLLGALGAPFPLIDGGEIIANGTKQVYVVWNFLSDYDSEIFFAKSTDSGKTFSFPHRISKAGPFESVNPVMAISDGKVFVAWSDGPSCAQVYGSDQHPCEAAIQFIESIDGGTTFSKPIELVHGSFAEGGFAPFGPDIKSQGESVYVTWMANRASGGADLFFDKISNGKVNPPINLTGEFSPTLEFYAFPKIYATGNSVYVAWETWNTTISDSGLYLVKSTDGGSRFSKIDSIPPGFIEVGRVSAQLAIQEDKQYFTWPSTLALRDVQFQTTNNGQASASSPLHIYSSQGMQNNTESFVPMAVDGDNVYLVWIHGYIISNTNLPPEILIRASYDGGKTFGPVTSVQRIESLPEFGYLIPLIAVGLAIVVVCRILPFSTIASR